MEAETFEQRSKISGPASVMRKAEESFSNLIELSPAQALLTEDIGKELKELASF